MLGLYSYDCQTQVTSVSGAAHGQQKELFAFQHEPDRNRDCFPELPADDADLDLAVRCFLQIVVWSLHTALGKKEREQGPLSNGTDRT
jgi:hypothetical protein